MEKEAEIRRKSLVNLDSSLVPNQPNLLSKQKTRITSLESCYYEEYQKRVDCEQKLVESVTRRQTESIEWQMRETDLQHRLEALSHEMERISAEAGWALERLRKEKTAWEKKEKELEMKICEHSASPRADRDTVKDLQEICWKQATQLAHKKKAHAADVQKRDAIITSLKGEILEQGKVVEHGNATIRSLRSEVTDRKQVIDKHEAAIRLLQGEVLVHEEDIQSRDGVISSLQSEVVDHKTHVKERDMTIESLQTMIKIQKADFEQRSTLIETLQVEMIKLKKSIEKRSVALQRIQGEADGLKTEQKMQAQKDQQTQDTITSLQNYLDLQTRDQARLVKDQNSTIKLLETELAGMRSAIAVGNQEKVDQIAALQHEVDALRGEQARLAKDGEQKQSQIYARVQEREELKRNISATKKEVATIIIANNELSTKLSKATTDISSANSAVSGMSESLKSQKAAYAQIHAELTTATAELDQARSQNGTLSSRLSSAENATVQLSSGLAAAMSSLSDAQTDIRHAHWTIQCLELLCNDTAFVLKSWIYAYFRAEDEGAYRGKQQVRSQIYEMLLRLRRVEKLIHECELIIPVPASNPVDRAVAASERYQRRPTSPNAASPSTCGTQPEELSNLDTPSLLGLTLAFGALGKGTDEATVAEGRAPDISLACSSITNVFPCTRRATTLKLSGQPDSEIESAWIRKSPIIDLKENVDSANDAKLQHWIEHGPGVNIPGRNKEDLGTKVKRKGMSVIDGRLEFEADQENLV